MASLATSTGLSSSIHQDLNKQEEDITKQCLWKSYSSKWLKIHFQNVSTDCAADDCSATLVEITDELSDPPFGQLIAFSVLPLASSHCGSLGGTVLLRGTDRRLADCSFPRLLIHFLQGFAYWNKGRFMSFRRLAKLNSAIRKIPFLVFSALFAPFCA
uniref:Uncharacterized protein n=1 Tax=Solanum tuberosum TaxID=4113 RepID=M1CCK6_SOLTU